jgi:hypothetical protein
MKISACRRTRGMKLRAVGEKREIKQACMIPTSSVFLYKLPFGEGVA